MIVLEPRREKMYTAIEVAKLIGVTESYVCRLLREGKMAGTRIGDKVWLVPESEVYKFREPPRRGRPRSRIV